MIIPETYQKKKKKKAYLRLWRQKKEIAQHRGSVSHRLGDPHSPTPCQEKVLWIWVHEKFQCSSGGESWTALSVGSETTAQKEDRRQKGKKGKTAMGDFRHTNYFHRQFYQAMGLDVELYTVKDWQVVLKRRSAFACRGP